MKSIHQYFFPKQTYLTKMFCSGSGTSFSTLGKNWPGMVDHLNLVFMKYLQKSDVNIDFAFFWLLDNDAVIVGHHISSLKMNMASHTVSCLFTISTAYSVKQVYSIRRYSIAFKSRRFFNLSHSQFWLSSKMYNNGCGVPKGVGRQGTE